MQQHWKSSDPEQNVVPLPVAVYDGNVAAAVFTASASDS
jgi:hypothetical protein